jgi:hypothetical protein
MRRLAFALTLLLSAGCSDPDANTDDVAGTSGGAGSTGDESETDEGGEPSSGGDVWLGEAATVRRVEIENGDCVEGCGGSVCIAAHVGPGMGIECDREGAADIAPYTCTCADFTEVEEAASTHAVSECWLDPNAEDDGFSMTRPNQWTGGPCGEWCGDNGLGECLGTLWTPGDECRPMVADGVAEYALYSAGPTVRPDDVPGPDGVFRFACEL